MRSDDEDDLTFMAVDRNGVTMVEVRRASDGKQLPDIDLFTLARMAMEYGERHGPAVD